VDTLLASLERPKPGKSLSLQSDQSTIAASGRQAAKKSMDDFTQEPIEQAHQAIYVTEIITRNRRQGRSESRKQHKDVRKICLSLAKNTIRNT
jgi:hypothetical protein